MPSRHPRFLVGNVLGRTFSIYFRNFLPFTILVAVVHLPYLIFLPFYVENAQFPDEGPMTREGQLWGLSEFGLRSMLGLVSAGPLCYGVFQQLRGRPASLGQCLGAGFTRLFPVLGVGLIVGIGVFIGSMLCLIPGLILTCMWWVAIPATVVEKAGVGGAIARSSALTKGNRMGVFVVILALGALGFILIMVGTGALTAALTAPDFDTEQSGVLGAAWGLWLAIAALLGSSLTAVASTVGYHDLRLAKEGIGTEELAAVFD